MSYIWRSLQVTLPSDSHWKSWSEGWFSAKQEVAWFKLRYIFLWCARATAQELNWCVEAYDSVEIILVLYTNKDISTVNWCMKKITRMQEMTCLYVSKLSPASPHSGFGSAGIKHTILHFDDMTLISGDVGWLDQWPLFCKGHATGYFSGDLMTVFRCACDNKTCQEIIFSEPETSGSLVCISSRRTTCVGFLRINYTVCLW